jgi:hypothetical protein
MVLEVEIGDISFFPCAGVLAVVTAMVQRNEFCGVHTNFPGALRVHGKEARRIPWHVVQPAFYVDDPIRWEAGDEGADLLGITADPIFSVETDEQLL